MLSNGVVDSNDAPTAAAGHLYDPGPSFSGVERPAERLAQMPAWLQTFAAAAGDPADDEMVVDPLLDMPTIAVATEDAPFEEGSDLPTWLTEERSAAVQAETGEPAPEAAGDAAVAAAAAATLISEDDLPEWLRAISTNDDDNADDLFSFGATPDGGVVDPRAVLTVPSVARAWMFVHDRPALSEGASIFALVARETVATALPSPAGSEPIVADAVAPAYEATQRGQSLASPARAASAGEQTKTSTPRPRWMIYLLALVLVAIVLIVLSLVL
jgi:hypothetical protein